MSIYMNSIHPSLVGARTTRCSISEGTGYYARAANVPTCPPFTAYSHAGLEPVSNMVGGASHSSARPITFDSRGAPACGLGVPILTLIKDGGSTLEAATDSLGLYVGNAKDIKLVLKWIDIPCEHTVVIEHAPGQMVSRAQLAVFVAHMVSSYVQTVTQAGGSNRLAHLLRNDSLLLSGLWNVAGDVWTAEVLMKTA
ncbi:hypothetical protein CONPUDRAFT_152669 [Coniophora puteana RWD-64-598 SS2]|uniref:Uncharacterized protein n=1 Tax=Coniophora puteana (strain RWD-64-598) TaxID=741705 RepID=A0A5M3MSZ0_CONPW|nr:uncharacterized protein CONPUDRAFT_152669 [Coniophora puteana RWD-64-598 SS2]EIW81765.1 hypothetical protein CONPUDRAFT_152669 [Coniophora puteana RWD-64-598 SS2]